MQPFIAYPFCNMQSLQCINGTEPKCNHVEPKDKQKTHQVSMRLHVQAIIVYVYVTARFESVAQFESVDLVQIGSIGFKLG